MKLNITRLLLIIPVTLVFYTSCKKTANAPVKATTDYSALSSMVATSLYKSLNGRYGGVDVSKGITVPANVDVANHRGLKLNSIASLCGFMVDTTYNTKATVGDTAKTFFGNFHFVYTCSTTSPDGYTVHDSLTNTEVGTKFNNIYTVAQDYTVKALDQTYKVVSMNGSNLTDIFTRVLNGQATTAYNQYYANYKLNGLVVDFTSGIADITSGTSTFNISTYTQGPNTPIDGVPGGTLGTITFLGKHMATLTLTNPAKSYTINLLTGAVTPL